MSARRFIFRDLPKVEGYIDALDALVFLALLETQHDRSLAGGLVDIGVYFGRSYFLMRRIVAPDSNVLAIDLFDLENVTHGRARRYAHFLENGRRLGLAVDEDMVIAGDSTRLAASDVTDRVGRVRFFSIDGGHTLAEVEADMRLARDTLADHGVIVFDDTFNPRWPEVTIAVADFLRANGTGFSAFCMTRFKTYVCRRPYRELYATALATSPHLAAFSRETVDLLGEKSILLQVPMKRRLLYELAAHSGFARMAQRVYGC